MTLLFALMMASLTHASSMIDGGMSGGGGEIEPGQEIGTDLPAEIYPHLRGDLYFLFNRQTHKASSPEMARLLNAGIFRIIESTTIYSSFVPCLDSNGREVDGSILSPPGTVCLSTARLMGSLSQENARNQALALLAHEYSHLLGFNEDDARKVQRQVLSLAKRDSMERVYDMFLGVKFDYGALRGAIIRHQPSNDWDALCIRAFKVMRYFGSIREHTRRPEEFAFFEDSSQKQFDSYFIKAQALELGACAHSQSYPDRDLARETYNLWFEDRDQISVAEIAVRRNDIPVDGTIEIRNVRTPEDFEAELADLFQHAESGFARAWFFQEMY